MLESVSGKRRRITVPEVPEPHEGTWSNCFVIGNLVVIAGMVGKYTLLYQALFAIQGAFSSTLSAAKDYSDSTTSSGRKGNTSISGSG